MPINTLEDAQERILELEGQVTELTNERDSLSENNKTLSADLEKVRTLNQKYFNMLTVQNSPQSDENNDEENEVQSCEDFARNTIII